jgi:hypothetical protein
MKFCFVFEKKEQDLFLKLGIQTLMANQDQIVTKIARKRNQSLESFFIWRKRNTVLKEFPNRSSPLFSLLHT